MNLIKLIATFDFGIAGLSAVCDEVSEQVRHGIVVPLYCDMTSIFWLREN